MTSCKIIPKDSIYYSIVIGEIFFKLNVRNKSIYNRLRIVILGQYQSKWEKENNIIIMEIVRRLFKYDSIAN